jgi:hypothetical protein
MADHLAADGYLEAGYEYLIIDDCWASKERDDQGRLQPNATRFPNGIKALADYVSNIPAELLSQIRYFCNLNYLCND